jgi:hypothetical protein
LRPDLTECLLEDCVAPAISNLGVIVLTTGGYLLLTPFPGAFVSPAGSAAGHGLATAASVSGTPFNLPFFIMGIGGLSSAAPGNITGIPSLAAAGQVSSAAAGAGVIISVGSGANEANAPVIPQVTRNTIANDRLNPPPLIGGQPANTSSLLPPPPAAAPVVVPPPMSGAAGGPTMPPPGSSLSGPFVRYPAMFPGRSPLGFPAGSKPGFTSGALAPATPLPPPGGVQAGPVAGGGP